MDLHELSAWQVAQGLAAKRFSASSRAASAVAKDAVQILGARGCSAEFPVERFFRDSQLMEIIEGSNQIIRMILSKYGFHEINKY